MIEWIKKQYVSIILVTLLCVFVATRLKVMLTERTSNEAQPSVSKSVNQTDSAGQPHHVSDEKKEDCVGPSCGKTEPTVNSDKTVAVTPTPSPTATAPASTESPIVAKEKACDEKYNQDCVDLAELKESQGDKAAALKLYQKACRPPEVDIEACGDAGRLLSFTDAEQARRDCEKGQLHFCLMVAGYYYERNDKAQAKQLTDYGCKQGLSEACVSAGYMMTNEDIKAAKEKCNMGSAADCLYVVGQGSAQEKSAQTTEYFSKACDLGDQTSCLHAGASVADDKVEALNKSCFWDGKVTACLLLIGKNSEEVGEGKDPELQKKLINKACDLGSKTACQSKEK